MEFPLLVVSEKQYTCKNPVCTIALNSNTQLGVQNKHLRLGVDGYLRKPFKKLELYNLIEVVLENKKMTLNTSGESLSDFTLISEMALGHENFIMKLLRHLQIHTPSSKIHSKLLQ
jgi:DNA-binding response OmpR family regulator